jgi:signal transduction histidine kinase
LEALKKDCILQFFNMRRLNRPVWVRYGAALVVIGAALAVKLLLIPLVTQNEPVLLFFAAVLVSAAFGGFGPGLLATVLGAMCDGYFFMAPFWRFRLDSADQAVRLVIFIFEGIVISVICARMREARQSAERSANEAHELEGQLLEISDAEQHRIGHDLHDGLGQQLTGIGLLSRRLEEMLASENSPAANEASRICSLAKNAVEWTRDLCHSLSPPTLESDGLPAALGDLAAHAENIFHVKCAFEQIGTAEAIDLASSVHFYRIAQEAISNAVRHGQAKHVRVRLDHSNGCAALQVSDDGAGIGQALESNDGMGLTIMRYRARMLGASIDIRRRDGGGTTVSCRRVASARRAV